MNSFERLSFNLLGKRMKAKREQYSALRNDLLSARFKTPFEVYLSTAYVSSILVGLSAAIVIGLFTWILKLPTLIKYKGAVPPLLVGLSAHALVLGTVFITIFSLLVFGGMTYLAFILYPGIEAGNRRRNIDASLPYAINYITSMSTAGITPAEIFRLLGDSPIYGQSAVEARYIAREIDIFGRDLIDALRLVSQSTPSKRMKEFLQGSMASISSGGNLTEYFRTKAEQYSIENRQNQKLFLDTLGLIAESYVTAMVAGTLFLIILQSIMSVLSGDNKPLFLYAIIYIMIPLGSIAFVIMISSMTPGGLKMALKDRFNSMINRGSDAPAPLKAAELSAAEGEVIEITNKLEHERQTREGLGKFLKHPLQTLTEKPVNILIVCIPLSILIFIGGFIWMVRSYGIQVLFNSTVIDDFAVLAVLISVVPLALLDLKEEWRVKNLENALPNFFRDLAGMNDSGMTLPNAVHLVAAAEYGALTPHIRRLDNEMSWGVGFVEAMYRFGKGLGTPLADRSVDLIAKASKAGGDISQVLRAAANDTFEVVNLASERNNNMLIYVVIVLVSFAVFLFVIAILVSTFLTTMATAGASAASAGAHGFMGKIDLNLYKRLFTHAAMLQGFFSGLVAGQMGEGRFTAGLKYSAMMLLISWITFRFFI